MLQSELQELMGLSSFQKLERRSLEAVVAADPTLHFCPTPDCPFILSWTDEQQDGPPVCDCQVCGKRSCLICGIAPYHSGMSCAEARRAQEAACPESTAANQRAFEEYVARSNIRACRRCGNGVVKSSGCNKMKCRCGYRFCYVCGKENALCGHTPSSHGFIDNTTGRGDFSSLRAKQSPT